MALNCNAMQFAETIQDGVKARRQPGDCNTRHMAGGAWLNNLSKNAPSRSLKGRAMDMVRKVKK